LDVVVRSMRLLQDKGLDRIRLMIAGAGDIQSLLRLGRQLGVSERIEYMGSIADRGKVASFLAGTDVGLIPFDANPLWSNALPAKLYEYCACGLGVLATVHENSLLSNFIRSHGIGFTSEPMDEAALAIAIRKMYDDRTFREEAGRRGRLLVEMEFDRGKIADDFLSRITAAVA